ncbi:amino acid permease [Apiospora saccharicola]|uniref:Amino acid permease n=1 Tax=Apiospora saccharicola TaxID=335842 RepID=A0ABR1U3Z6_9PEZI
MIMLYSSEKDDASKRGAEQTSDATIPSSVTSSEGSPLNGDEARLAQAGYAQELDRTFSLPSLIALSLCLMATWEALSGVVSAALTSGGAPCLFYNYVLSYLCAIAIACSLGEIASIYPTAGGQYYWVAALAPVSSRRVASYATGWISLGAQIIFTTSACFAAGLQLQALIIMNNSSYIPERWHAMLLVWAVLAYSAAINIYGPKLLPHLNLASGVVHIAGFVAIIVILGVMSTKASATFVFVKLTNATGWESNGVAWLVGLISAVYPFLGYDAACHLSEEIPDAARSVPLAMVGSVVVNGIMGLVYCLVFLFSISNLDSLLSTNTGFPYMQLFHDVTNSAVGATFMSLVVAVLAMIANMSGATSTSRTFWAFARDKAVPFDRYFSVVSDANHVPVRCILVITAFQMLLGFIYLGNTTAFNAILSMSIISMYLSYMAPIGYMLFGGRERLDPHLLGPFRLGRPLGRVLNVVSLIWMTVAIVFSTFPTAMPVTPQNMNYSIVVLAGWLLWGVLYYAWRGRHKYDVPVVGAAVVTAIVA